MYDAEMGFPGLIIDGTACAGGGGDPLSLSESYEDIMARGSWPQAKRDRRLQIDQNPTRPMLERGPTATTA